METIDLDSLEDIKDISFNIGGRNDRASNSNSNSNRPNLITRDPPPRSSNVSDSSFGLDLIMNKDKQRRNLSPSPKNSPAPSFSEEPRSSFSDNIYSKIDNNTPNLNEESRHSRDKFNLESYLEDELQSNSKPSITKLVDSPTPIELKPPSGNGFNFDDDILNDDPPRNNSNSNSNYNSNNGFGNSMNDYSNNGNNYGNNSGNGYERPMSVEEMQKKKFELLCKLERLKKKGVVVPRTYTMNSSYEEIKYEYEKLHNERLMDNSVKMYRQMLVSATTAIEYVNTKANPFEFYLEGWSDQVYSQQHDYDEIFEEIYEKYKDKASMPPELRLLLSLGGSALMYHLSNTMFKSVLPGAQDILRQNPDLMKHMQQTLLNTMAQQGPAEATFAGMMGGAMNSGNGGNGGYDPTSNGNPNAQPRNMNMNMNGSRRQMSGPDGLDSFLNDITGNTKNQMNVDL